MGILSDYFEDSSERYGQYLQERGFPMESIVSLGPLSPSVVFPCTVCRNPFFSRDDLNGHIRSSHALEHVYLLADGKVIRDAAYFAQGLKRIEPVLLGVASARVVVGVAGRGQPQEFQISETSISPLELSEGFEGEVTISIKPVDRRERQFCLYVRSLPNFRAETLDGIISELQVQYDANRERPSLQAWQGRVKMPLSALEDRYFRGSFEYTLGTYLEAEGRLMEAKDRLEESFGLLLPFRTGLALTILRILGLKMNCFSLLLEVPSDSPFATADAFFNRRKNECALPIKQAMRREGESRVVADEFTTLCLDALSAFYAKDDSLFLRLRGRMEIHPLTRNRNNQDKLDLISARFDARSRNASAACEHYECLVDHPDFGQEARRYLDGQPRR